MSLSQDLIWISGGVRLWVSVGMVGDVRESEKQIGIARDAMFDEKNMVGIEVYDPHWYGGTSLTKNSHLRMTTIGPYAWGYCRVLRGEGFL